MNRRNRTAVKLLTRLANWASGSTTFPIQFDITNACNLNCSHCYHSDHINKGALDFIGWERIIADTEELLDFLQLNPVYYICGGEPLLSSNLFLFIEKLQSLRPRAEISILTNGLLLSDNLLEKFRDHGISLQISLDGPDEQSHDKFRGQGRFNKTIDKIRLAQQYQVNTHLLATLTRENSKLIDLFFKLAAELKVQEMNFTRLVELGAALKMVKQDQDASLNPLELKAAYEAILLSSAKHQVKTATDKPLFTLLDSKLGESGRLGHSGIVVDYKGNLKVSSRSGFVVGNLVEQNLLDLFLNHPLYRDLRSGKIETCGSCKYYSRCGGYRTAAFAATGSFLAKDPGCWL